jgi:hypothetical protein
MKDFLPEEPEPISEPVFDQRPRTDGNGTWFWLQEAPFEAEESEEPQEALTVEFRRVKSLREEQESKIAMFLREDKTKGRGEPMKNESPVGKYSQSLSPRKTKKIDKSKLFKPQEDTFDAKF